MTAALALDLTVDYGHLELLPVYFDDLDPMGVVHNARFALLIERALAAFWGRHGHPFVGVRPSTPDTFNVVKEFSISYRAPIRRTGAVAIHFWLEHLGQSSAVYGFRVLSANGATVFTEVGARRSTPHLVALVRAGATFHKGKLLERPVDLRSKTSPAASSAAMEEVA